MTTQKPKITKDFPRPKDIDSAVKYARKVDPKLAALMNAKVKEKADERET